MSDSKDGMNYNTYALIFSFTEYCNGSMFVDTVMFNTHLEDYDRYEMTLCTDPEFSGTGQVLTSKSCILCIYSLRVDLKTLLLGTNAATTIGANGCPNI